MFGIGKLEERIEKLERYVNLLEREILNVQEYCKLRTENKTYLKSSIRVEGNPVLTKDVVEKILDHLNLTVERLLQEESIELVGNQKVKVAKVSIENENLLPEKPFVFEDDSFVHKEKKEKKHRKRKFNEFDNYLKKLVDDRIGYLDQLCMEYALTNRDPGWIQKELELAKSLYLQISENKL